MKIQLEVHIPEGYEPTGEYRKVNAGEYYLFEGRVHSWSGEKLTNSQFIILKKKWQTPKHLEGKGYFLVKNTFGSVFINDGNGYSAIICDGDGFVDVGRFIGLESLPEFKLNERFYL